MTLRIYVPRDSAALAAALADEAAGSGGERASLRAVALASGLAARVGTYLVAAAKAGRQSARTAAAGRVPSGDGCGGRGPSDDGGDTSTTPSTQPPPPHHPPGTAAALAGGFTSIACMPNTDPPIDSQAAVEFVRVPYDHERLAGALSRTDLITTFQEPA